MLATMVNGANETTGVSAFGRMCPNMIAGSDTPVDDRGADVVLRLLPIELAAHVVRDAHPVERRENHDEQPERRLQQLHAPGM